MLFGKDVMIGACADPLEVVGPDGEHAVSEIVLSISARARTSAWRWATTRGSCKNDRASRLVDRNVLRGLIQAMGDAVGLQVDGVPKICRQQQQHHGNR